MNIDSSEETISYSCSNISQASNSSDDTYFQSSADVDTTLHYSDDTFYSDDTIPYPADFSCKTNHVAPQQTQTTGKH